MTFKKLATFLATVLLTVAAHAATLLPPGEQQFLDGNGAPLAEGSVYFFIPGTSTFKNTYQDAGSTTLNSNPVILDSAGKAIIYGSGAYRQVLKDATGNVIWDQLTADTSSSQTSWAGRSGGTANVQTVTAASFTAADGQIIGFVANATNTAALSLNPNNTGPINVLKDTVSGPVSLTGGEVTVGNVVQVIYDATAGAFHIFTTPPSPPVTMPVVNLASSTTTDLGATGSTVVNITGTTTIASFGSSAVSNYPLYFLKFAGSLQLTYNATSLILPTSGNITTVAGDSATALYLGSGNWQVISYSRANGTALSPFALPNQSGKRGYGLTTDGTNPYWTALVPVASVGATSTGSFSPTLNFANNIASVTRTSTGQWTFTFSSALANTGYSIATGGYGTPTSGGVLPVITSKSTSGFVITFVNSANGTTADPVSSLLFDFTVFGGI